MWWERDRGRVEGMFEWRDRWREGKILFSVFFAADQDTPHLRCPQNPVTWLGWVINYVHCACNDPSTLPFSSTHPHLPFTPTAHFTNSSVAPGNQLCLSFACFNARVHSVHKEEKKTMVHTLNRLNVVVWHLHWEDIPILNGLNIWQLPSWVSSLFSALTGTAVILVWHTKMYITCSALTHLSKATTFIQSYLQLVHCIGYNPWRKGGGGEC